MFGFKDHPQCALPTDRYAHIAGYKENAEVENGAMKDSSVGLGFYWSISQLMRPAKIKNDYGVTIDPLKDPEFRFTMGRTPETSLQLEIKVGDVEVDAWFKANQRHQKTYEKLCKALGRIAEKTLEVQERQKLTLSKLAALTAKRSQLLKNIQDTTSFLRYQPPDEHNIVVAQNRVWELSFKELLKQFQDTDVEIKNEVATALEIGLSNIESIQTLTKQYDIKI